MPTLTSKDSHLTTVQLGDRPLRRADGIKYPDEGSTAKKVRRAGGEYPEGTRGKKTVENAQVGWLLDSDFDVAYIRAQLGRETQLTITTSEVDGDDNPIGQKTIYLGPVSKITRDDSSSTDEGQERWLWLEQLTEKVRTP